MGPYPAKTGKDLYPRSNNSSDSAVNTGCLGRR